MNPQVLDTIVSDKKEVVQANWKEENPNASGYIKNKPQLILAFDTEKHLVCGVPSSRVTIDSAYELISQNLPYVCVQDSNYSYSFSGSGSGDTMTGKYTSLILSVRIVNSNSYIPTRTLKVYYINEKGETTGKEYSENKLHEI